MRTIVLGMVFCIVNYTHSQVTERISTIDFLQIVDGNKVETIFYYENNWKVLRDMALEKDYIHSYQLLETEGNDEVPFDMMLITTYSDQLQYEKSEANFDELILEKGELKLLNDKKPGEFRKIIMTTKSVKHLY